MFTLGHLQTSLHGPLLITLLIKKAVHGRPYPFKKEWRSFYNLLQRYCFFANIAKCFLIFLFKKAYNN